MNNKGFAITSIIYGLMLLFVMVVASFLSVLVGRNRRMDDLLEGVRESLDYPVIKVEYDTTSNYFYKDIDNSGGFNNIIDDNNDDKLDDNSEALNLNAGVYITPQKGKYDFSSIINDCILYLPMNIAIVYGSYFDSSVSGLYYNTVGGEFTTDSNVENYYKQLCS